MASAQHLNELSTLLGPFWSGARTQEALACSDSHALRARQAEGSLLALTTSDGVTLYPVFQFHRRNGMIEVKAPLVDVLYVLQEFDPWSVATLLRTPAPELDGLTPIEWVDAQRPRQNLRGLASKVAREWGHGVA